MMRLENDIERRVADGPILETLAMPDVQGNATVMKDVMRRRVQVKKEAGEWKLVVVDGAGNAMFADGQGTPMTVKQLALEMKKDPDYAPNFASTARSGSGTLSDGAGRGGASGAAGGSGKKEMKKSEVSGALTKEQVERHPTRGGQRHGKKMSGHLTDDVFSRYNIQAVDDLKDAAQKIEEGAARTRETDTKTDISENARSESEQMLQ